MPMDNELDLTALRMFRAVVRERSFSAAALAMRAPKSTVSKRVADLESALGVRLIERSTRSMRVTTEGEVLAARADRLLADADDIRRTLGDAGSAPRGHLRIAVPPTMGHAMMGRLGAQFRALHPEISLEVHFTDRPPDLVEAGFDGCVRMGEMDDSGQVARLIMHGNAVLAAAPGHPALGRVEVPADLAHVPLIGLAEPWPGGWSLLNTAGKTADFQPSPGLVLGSFAAVRDAALAGGGVAMLPWLLARPEFEAGRLIRVLPDWSTERKPIWFVYPSAQSVTARLRAFIDFLVAAVRTDLGANPP